MGSANRGLSVLEVLIGVTVLLIGFLFLLGVFPVSFQGIGKARNLQFATNLAQQNMENFVTWYGTSSSGGFLNAAPVVPGGGTGTQAIKAVVNGQTVQTQFTWQVSGSPDCTTVVPLDPSRTCPANPQPFVDYNLVHLTSWVRWQEYQGSLVTAPSGAPSGIGGGYGAHFLSVETWVYLP